MKKLIFILLIMLSFSAKETKAQITDSLAYLQTIVANKSTYIGQPFSVLIDSLQIQVKYFHPQRGIINDTSKETSTRFAFYFPNSADDLYLSYPSIVIFWQVALNANQSDIFWGNNNGGGWTNPVANFYASGIILDIQIRE